MHTPSFSSRLTLLFPNLEMVYKESNLQIDEDTLLKVSADNSSPFVVYSQEQYTWNMGYSAPYKACRFTYNDVTDQNYHPILKPVLENGYLKYSSGNNSTKYNDYKEFQDHIFSHFGGHNTADGIKDELIDVFRQNDGYKSVDLVASSEGKVTLQFTHAIDIVSDKDYLLDLALFDDTGIFYATRRADQRETNIQGLLFNLQNRTWKKTNFYINTFINTIPIPEEVLSLRCVQEGIHPEITLKSSFDSSKIPFRKADLCERYWLLSTPKDVFVNKFDNELKFDTEVWSLVEQNVAVDLELPAYKISNYSQAYTLFKQNKEHVNGASEFKFNLHNRYIDSEKRDADGYTSFDFESTVFDVCETGDPALTFTKSPFMEKTDLGGFISARFLNSTSPKVYCNVLAQSVERIRIPSPETGVFYSVQWATWVVVVLSAVYLVKKCLKKELK